MVFKMQENKSPPALLLSALLFFLILFCCFAAVQASATADNEVYVIKINGMVTEGAALEVADAIKEAKLAGYEAVLVEIDTPGGLVDATLKIAEAILNARMPVITYVTPSGAIAASAGSFILLSGSVAAMSPGTTVGAAMPVAMTFEGVKTADEKTIKFFAGHIESIARSRGRNETQARLFVTENAVLGEDEALRNGIIDLTAEDERELLEKIDGWEVETAAGTTTLNTKDATLRFKKKSVKSQLLQVLSDPLIAFILFLVGIYGLVFGFMTPGYGAEVVGAVCLVLALYGMGMFDVNIFAAVLIVVAVVLFVAEALTPTFGVLTVGGVICLVLGALFLPNEPFLIKAPSWFAEFKYAVIAVVVSSAAFFVFALGVVLKTRRKKVAVGAEELIGKVTKAETDINEDGGFVRIRGELWNARSKTGNIKRGEKVKIVGREGLTVIVERSEDVEEAQDEN
ncbi:NfeD family protein [Candidatus Alkanophaga liquidiphilum]